MQSSKRNNQFQEEEDIKVLSVDKLQQQFLNLQQDWEIFKKSNPTKSQTLAPTKTRRPIFSSSKSDHNNLMVKTLDLLGQSSPRTLMSSLQLNLDNINAMNSAVRERREAIVSGSIKGRRRLFESYEGFGDNDEEINNVDSHEVRSVLSFDESEDCENDEFLGITGEIDVSAVWLRGYSCSLTGQRVIERSEVMVKNEREKESRVIKYGKMPYNNNVVILVIPRFVVLICVVFAIYFVVRGFSDQVDIGESDMILVPT